MHILKKTYSSASRAGPTRADDSEQSQELYRSLNLAIIDVCRDLPGCLQIPATLQLMAGGRRPATGTPVSNSEGEAQDFCAEFPMPLWSVLIAAGSPGDGVLPPEWRATATKTQAMAFLLHLIDDHLCDGQTGVDVLVLQLRTAVWNRFESGVGDLRSRTAGSVDPAPILQWVDDYFASTYRPDPPFDLDSYLSLAARQMAIWSVAPALLALVSGGDLESSRRIHRILQAVSLAWRITDDVEDRREDTAAGHKSALYYLSPPDAQRAWEAAARCSPGGSDRALASEQTELARQLDAARIPGRARELARDYFTNARELAQGAGWNALAGDIADTEIKLTRETI